MNKYKKVFTTLDERIAFIEKCLEEADYSTPLEGGYSASTMPKETVCGSYSASSEAKKEIIKLIDKLKSKYEERLNGC